MAKQKDVAVKCGRCNGKGSIASFSIKFSGKCFACDGSGVRYMSRAAYEKRMANKRAMEAYFAEQRAKHPICKACGYAMGGADGWTEHACKCGHTSSASASVDPEAASGMGQLAPMSA